MQSCQPWASTSHIRHPWFDHALKKRKDREREEDVDVAALKRRRYTGNLEHGFAGLTLGAGIEDVEMEPAPVLADAVEESVEIPEVNMKTSSWYEPEPDRIVITDLESFTQSDDEEEGKVSINTVLLDRMRALAKGTLPTETSQALVLFKPIVVESKREKRVDADAMDVED